MKKHNFTKLFSTFLAIILVLSLLTPFSASANTDSADLAGTAETAEKTVQATKAFKENLQNESVMERKAAIAEQLNLLGGEAKLHEELQNVTGNQQVPVIIHLSEKSVGLQQGIQKLNGKPFSSAEAQQTKQKVRNQQAAAKKEMVIKGIQFNQGFSYDTVLNGMSGTVKADDLPKLLEVNGVKLVEPDTTVYALELDKSKSSSKLNGLKKPAPSESKLEEKAKDNQVGPAMDTSIGFLGIEALWAEGLEGQGIKVAVLDTGIDADHPDFQGIYKGGKNFVPHTGNDYARPRADDDASETSPVERPSHRPEFNDRGSSFYTSHGTHVAGTIAAIGNNEYGIKGIAPKVDLYAYRVLGAYGSGSTSGIIAAIDTAVQEGMDVINLSLGGGSNTETDAGSFAINNAMLAGTISVVATGNSGPNRGTMGTPSTARLGIAVGNTTNPELSTVNFEMSNGEFEFSNNVKFFFTPIGKNLKQELSGELDIIAIPGVGKESDYDQLDITGKVVHVSRGEIAFLEKIQFATEKGAKAIIIYNTKDHADGNDNPMSNVGSGDVFDVSIPSFNMSYNAGKAILDGLNNGEGKITFDVDNFVYTSGDEVNDSSSRGPSTPNFDIKPDVTAPGTNIMSTIPMYKADFPEATYEQAYARKTGTSMATPHIAGIAALVKQANPNWDAFDVKVALSNTAKVLDTGKYDVFAQGAGRVQAYQAAHPEILAYAIDTASNDGVSVENKKGTVTFGPQDLTNDISVTKQILVKNENGNGGTYNASVQVTKGFGDATVTIDKPTFTLSGEQLLNVTLTASAASTKSGDEILGYINIEGGSTTASLPFAAEFGGEAATEVQNMRITETDLSFNGDGVKDEAMLYFTITGDVATNYVELWDIMDPEGGVYEDGYIGYLHASDSLGAGSYQLRIGGQYRPWDGTPPTMIPDGLYTIDFTALSASGVIGDYVGPVVVKSEAGTIEGAIEGTTATGQIDDAYIQYQEELVWYGLGYDINTKLKASYEVVKEDEVVASGPIKLEQDGTFTFDLPELNKKDNSVKVKYEDAAGNKAEAIIYNAGDQVDDEVEYALNHESLTLEVGASEQLTVTETTTKADGTTEEKDVTADATFTSADETIATVENGNITAVSAGTTDITVTYKEFTATVTIEIAAEVEDTVTYAVNKTNLVLEAGQQEQLFVTETITKPDGTTEEKDVTADAAFTSANTAVATVENGNVIAVAKGTTDITVTYEDYTETVAVEVTDKPVGEETVTYSVNKTQMVLGEGQQEQLYVTQTTVKPDGTVIEKDVTGQLRYNVVNNTYATVQKGLVTAKKAGKTQVRVMINGQETIYVYLEVTKKLQNIVTYTVSQTHLNIGVGQQEQVYVTETTVTPEGDVSERDVTGFGAYKVIDNSVATVKKGLVTGQKAGKSQLRIEVKDQKGVLKETIYVYINVEALPQDIVTYALSTTEMTMEVGEQKQLKVTETTVAPDGRTTQRDATVDSKFNVVNNTLATVQRGLVTAHAPGKTQVRVVMPNGEVTLVYLEVTGAPVQPEQPQEPETPDTITFAVNKDRISLLEGETDQLTVTQTTTKADGTFVGDNDATASSTFTSANEHVATVANGIITATGAGETEITVTNSDFTATVSVTVTAVEEPEVEVPATSFIVTEEIITSSPGEIVLDLSAFEGETDIEVNEFVLRTLADSNKEVVIQKDGAVFSLHKNVFKDLHGDLTISIARSSASEVINAVSDIYTITFWNGIGDTKQQLTSINHKIDVIMSVFGNKKVQIFDLSNNREVEKNANVKEGKVKFKTDNAGSFVAIEI
ncbi:S8 family serine peptidase [Sporosarcina koreensis]|uniref:S8 family serine peptidase n=1 Tax=Sporosarcina koreensis TaxID=334735 RepID=UPI0009E707E6|nr:S8 family serine peptidase [Sporosarcina koreensis]